MLIYLRLRDEEYIIVVLVEPMNKCTEGHMYMGLLM